MFLTGNAKSPSSFLLGKMGLNLVAWVFADQTTKDSMPVLPVRMQQQHVESVYKTVVSIESRIHPPFNKLRLL